MCGIVGYGGFTKKKSLDKSLTMIAHRGPDGSGAQYMDDIALGNTRLAIIDLSEKGHQPMYSQNKDLCITFNGEIYNFREIKELLVNKYPFKSDTDTEVILYAYQEWGVKCLDRLSGMFSFVIYDSKKKLLFGARDRLGQKPLKYFYKEGLFIFASEIKAIRTLMDSKPELDEVSIDNFLTLQYVPAPQTGFKNIYKLPAGHYFIFKDKQLHIKKYWSLDFKKKLNLTKTEWEELVYSEIKSAVRSHLISDVPVGALLSGGIDSSIIVAIMAGSSSKPVNTFNIGFDDESFDESRYAKIVSKIYKTSHHHLRITSADLIKSLPEIVKIYDEPIADNSILPTALISKLAAAKVKVALTGDGGDENFAGYDRYFFIKIFGSLSKSPALLKKALGLAGKLGAKTYPTKLTQRASIFLSTLNQPFDQAYVHYSSFFSYWDKQNLYSNIFKESVGNNNTHAIFKDLFDPSIDPLDNALKIDINTYLPDDLLYKTDSASMAYGLELRSPFLDHNLMEKMASMPSDIKLNLGQKKEILKDIALKQKLLPKELINRPKHGFIAPLNKWFKNDLKKDIYDLILSSDMIEKIFSEDKIKRYLDNYYNHNLNYYNHIFALLVLALWFNENRV